MFSLHQCLRTTLTFGIHGLGASSQCCDDPLRPPALSETGPPPKNLSNPHAIAITVKTVPGLHRVTVRGQNQFTARERADQDEQRGLRKMEICQELIDHAELVAGLDENVRLPPGPGSMIAGSLCFNAALAAASSRARTTVVPIARMGRALSLRIADRGSRLLGNFISLRVHLVLRRFLPHESAGKSRARPPE